MKMYVRFCAILHAAQATFCNIENFTTSNRAMTVRAQTSTLCVLILRALAILCRLPLSSALECNNPKDAARFFLQSSVANQCLI